MRYLLLAALALGACALEPYEAPDGSMWPSMAAYEETQRANAIVTWCAGDQATADGLGIELCEAQPQLKVME